MRLHDLTTDSLLSLARLLTDEHIESSHAPHVRPELRDVRRAIQREVIRRDAMATHVADTGTMPPRYAMPNADAAAHVEATLGRRDDTTVAIMGTEHGDWFVWTDAPAIVVSRLTLDYLNLPAHE